MTVEEVKLHVLGFTDLNISKFPIKQDYKDSFRSMWNRSGPDAARTMMIPLVWNGICPPPMDVL